MEQFRTAWPHAPTHQLSQGATYFVTAGTYQKVHHFRRPERLDVLQRGLLKVAQDFGWHLEAWAVFSNHYHFVGHSPDGVAGASSLSQMLGVLHVKTDRWVNRLDRTPGRQVWHNFWETRLTYQKSYLARLNYVHQNPVKHDLAAVANQSRREPSGSAGGLLEFDSSGNRPALRVGARPVPPHPNPLPKEREPHRPCSRTLGVLRSTARRDRLLPLPKGEGWGEGEGDARTTHIVRMGLDIRPSPERSWL